MRIKQITIEGVQGDVEIMAIAGGALVTRGNDILCEMRADDDAEARYAKACEVAKAVYGEVKKTTRYATAGEPNATNSMIHDVMREIERLAGC